MENQENIMDVEIQEDIIKLLSENEANKFKNVDFDGMIVIKNAIIDQEISNELQILLSRMKNLSKLIIKNCYFESESLLIFTKSFKYLLNLNVLFFEDIQIDDGKRISKVDTKRIRSLNIEAQSNTDNETLFLNGDRIEVKLKGWTMYYKGEIILKNNDGTYDVKVYRKNIKCIHKNKITWIDNFIKSCLLLKSLKVLSLKKNNINSKGIRIIAKQLPFFEKLESLDLSNNIIRNKGCFDLATVIPMIDNLKLIDLENNQIDYQGGKSLLKVFENSNLNEIKLFNNRIFEKFIGNYETFKVKLINRPYDTHYARKLLVIRLLKINTNKYIFLY